MAKPKTLLVRRNEHLELSERNALILGGVLKDLRPRTSEALRTLIGRPAKNPARLHDSKSFEKLTSTKGHLELLADKEGRVGGISISTFRAVAQALPSGAKMPKTIKLPAYYFRRPWQESTLIEMSLDPRVRDFQLYCRALFFQDVIVDGGLLTINYPIFGVRNFILRHGGRVRQRTPLVIDISGRFVREN